jgi:dihydroorotate dehydrogenase electron transfer subunit
MMQVKASILSNTKLMAGAHLLELNAPEIAAAAMPGQFVMVDCGPDVILRRPFSIHDVNNSSQISILFNVIGKGTSWLAHCKKGTGIDLLGPSGNGYTIRPTAKHLLLIAGGIGIAPLVFLSKQALAQGKEITLLLGARTSSGLYPKNHLPDKIQTIIATEDGSSGRKGMVSDILPDFLEDADEVFACGPLGMYRAIVNVMKRMSIKKNVQVSLETRMGCGIGSCYGCSIRTTKGMKMVCKDGPIFSTETIIWQEVKV